jgi:hypothetical protein
MSEARIDSISNESNTGGPVLSGITEFSGQQYFIPPSGTTAERPSDCPPGSIRFNTDSAHLEYWNGLVWLEFEASSEELGNQNVSNSAGGTGTRAVFAGGNDQPAGYKNEIDYISISTLGNAQDFGDLSAAKNQMGSASSRTIGLFFGGYTPSIRNEVEKLVIASTGSSVDSGVNMSQGKKDLTATSNETRYIIFGGRIAPNNYNNIEYGDFSVSGSPQDFGDLSTALSNQSAFASSVRAIAAGGYEGPANTNNIEYVTISTLGDSQDFGDLTVARTCHESGCSNSTRGLVMGGSTPSSPQTVTTDFVQIATTGNAQDFGDLNEGRSDGGATASSTRAVLGGGGASSSESDAIDFMTIATTGNGTDFGNLTVTRRQVSGISNGHGGL